MYGHEILLTAHIATDINCKAVIKLDCDISSSYDSSPVKRSASECTQYMVTQTYVDMD